MPLGKVLLETSAPLYYIVYILKVCLMESHLKVTFSLTYNHLRKFSRTTSNNFDKGCKLPQRNLERFSKRKQETKATEKYFAHHWKD